ncbi:MAG: ABC transporter ATP-binding protein [Clostridiales bacterium]|nr:ABC transporter ATP-binding protein [Candidatus Cacconaster stercorequi]
MNHVLEIKNLTVDLPGFSLNHITMDIPRGVVVGLIGRNGAGKTTLLRTITDIYAPNEGTILYDGIPMRGNETMVKAKMGIVYDTMYYPANTKAINLAKMLAPLYPDFDMERWHQLMSRFGLDEKKRPMLYSKGMQMKFMLAMVLARDPELLILDEPTAGMDPAARAEMLELMQEFMQDETKTVLFSTHITSDLDKIADYIALIADGKLVCMEEKDALLEKYVLAQIPHGAMNEEICADLIGKKENSFGCIGLSRSRSLLAQIPGVQLTRPSIEDLLIYGGGHEE